MNRSTWRRLVAVPVCAALALVLVSLQDSTDAPVARFPLAADVVSPEALALATYASIAREPGEDYQWERFQSLFLPGALLISNVRQTGGEFRPISAPGFEEWISRVAPHDREGDRGFAEEQVWQQTEQYGVIAHVLSTYQKHFAKDERILGRGINSFQMVKHEDRWWITSLIWDEASDAGPIPAKYGGVPPEK